MQIEIIRFNFFQWIHHYLIVIRTHYLYIYLINLFRKYSIKKYLYTINHKRLSLNYIYFSLVTALSGATLATAIRFEMAYPGSPLSMEIPYVIYK